MNDTVKWILAVFITAVAFYAGSDLLGIDWVQFQASILGFARLIGTLLLLFTGSAAAIEVARYYHRLNDEMNLDRSADRGHVEDDRSLPTATVNRQLPEAHENVTRSELEAMLKQAVSEVVREENDEIARKPADRARDRS